MDDLLLVLDLPEAKLESDEVRIFASSGSPCANIEALYDLENRLMVVKRFRKAKP